MKKSELKQLINQIISEQGAGPRPTNMKKGTMTLGDFVNNFEGTDGCSSQELQALMNNTKGGIDPNTPIKATPAHAVYAVGAGCVYLIGWATGWW